MNLIFIFIALVSFLGIAYAVFNYKAVVALDEGTEQMSKIAAHIRAGANAFLLSEYKQIVKYIVIIGLFFGIVISIHSSISFIIGTIMSSLPAIFGMRASTYANVRTTNVARLTGNPDDTGPALQVALKGGSVMGLSVASSSLIGLLLVFTLFRDDLNTLEAIPNWLRIFTFVPMTQNLSSYALGCSTIAIFNRVGGGIYTKAADMGADLVGKTELKLPEDDPRNPGAIADSVGDNVGDTAGLGSDILESNVGAIVSACIIAFSWYIDFNARGAGFSVETLERMYTYPIAFSAVGLVACIISLTYIFSMKNAGSPHKVLNQATYFAAVFSAIGNLILTFVLLGDQDFSSIPFLGVTGALSPYFASLCGIIAGVAIGIVTEHYTSYDYSPTRLIANAANQGDAILLTQSFAVSLKSTLLTILVLIVAMYAAGSFADLFGMAMAAVGMLSFVGITVSIDTYGPTSDNAGGIAEMAKLPENTRKITDRLDAEGNTTAAIGKGFAIGSATFVSICQMSAYLYIFTPSGQEVSLNVMDRTVFIGMLLGGAFACFFSGLLLNSVKKSAGKMVDEIRRQFKEIPGLKEGTAEPDYTTCIKISAEGALHEMKLPALIAILVPLVSGFIMGPRFVAGILVGNTVVSVPLAILFGNLGGACDNAKKYIESLGLKGTLAHLAAVVGDTFGDPLKDTVGPSLDIFIKIMNTVAMVAVPIFAQYNLVDALSSVF